MKKQICFAGFAEAELEALRPSLAAVGGAWDCVFAADATSALEAMAVARFDAVVANISHKGMNDADLLHKTAIQHPRTLRIVLGDVADRELIVNCVGATHQFISRPWQPDGLITIIGRSLALDAWLTTDKLRAFIPRLGKLPGLPASYFEVLKKAESPTASIDSIAEVIARDPALTARLLQMVNSPACGLAEKITKPSEAVSMLGVETVKSLVLCLQLFSESAPAESSGISLDQLWQHSFHVAKLAAKIVLRSVGNERMASDAYTAGLLHNIGQIVLATNLFNEYAAVVETARKLKCSLQEAETKLLGVTSTQVGAYLLGVWGLPLPLLESTALHHSPSSTKSVEFTVLTAVHVANVLASEAPGRDLGLPLPKLDSEYLEKLELPRKTDAWRKFLASMPQQELLAASVPERRARSLAASAPGEGAPTMGKFLVFAGVAAVIVTAVAVMKHTHNAAPPAAASSNTEEMAAAVGETNRMNATQGSNGTNAAAAGSEFDAIKIQGIFFNAGHPVALISGKSLGVGESINGVQVVSIEPSSVVLACNGNQKTFKVK